MSCDHGQRRQGCVAPEGLGLDASARRGRRMAGGGGVRQGESARHPKGRDPHPPARIGCWFEGAPGWQLLRLAALRARGGAQKANPRRSLDGGA
jgi:hypothetical protein